MRTLIFDSSVNDPNTVSFGDTCMAETCKVVHPKVFWPTKQLYTLIEKLFQLVLDQKKNIKGII